VYLYGRTALTLLFKIEGKLVKLSFNGQESVGYATFGGKQWFSYFYKRTNFNNTFEDV
jgi:hypothetical protein